MPGRALAIDLGSSSVRALVFESEGTTQLVARPGALARRRRHVDSREPGQATFDPDSYLADLVACIDELASAGHLEGVTEVAMDSQWHSAMAVGPDGAALTEALSWADTRPVHEGEDLAPERCEELRQRTGAEPAPMYWTWRLPWLRRKGAPGPGGRFLGLPEYIGLHLLGDASSGISIASATGLLATAAHDWDAEALEVAQVGREELPEIAPPGWRGTLRSEWARRWPSLAGLPWHPALGDGAAANLGMGCGLDGRAALTIGTSAAVRVVRPATGGHRLAPGLWRYCVDRDRAVLGAAYSSGGQLYSWALALWEATSTGATGTSGGAASHAGSVSAEVRYDVAPPVGAGSDGVVVLPWHAGTRPPAAPVPAGQGCLLGLGLGHGGGHVVSAAAEAVCFQLADGLRQLEEGAAKQLEVVANGGAIEGSRWWQQRLAATLARTITVATVPETTARGAAAEALGANLSGQTLEGDRVVPAQVDVEALGQAGRRWAELYRRLLPVVGSRPV